MTTASARWILLFGIIAVLQLTAEALTEIAQCVAVDCDAAGGVSVGAQIFQQRVTTAFGACERFDSEPQQCLACADAVYAQMPETADGRRCVTRGHFQTCMDFCLAVVKEYDSPLSGTLDAALEDEPVPPVSVQAVPLTSASVAITERGETVGVLHHRLLPQGNGTASMRYVSSCAVKWVTKPGYIIYPACANLVCALYGSPQVFRSEVETCCQERSHHLGGDNWLKNCWYSAE